MMFCNSKQKVLNTNLYKSTIGVRQEGHREFGVLRWSSKNSDSKASVKWLTYSSLHKISTSKSTRKREKKKRKIGYITHTSVLYENKLMPSPLA